MGGRTGGTEYPRKGARPLVINRRPQGQSRVYRVTTKLGGFQSVRGESRNGSRCPPSPHRTRETPGAGPFGVRTDHSIDSAAAAINPLRRQSTGGGMPRAQGSRQLAPGEPGHGRRVSEGVSSPPQDPDPVPPHAERLDGEERRKPQPRNPDP
jgi:hypothetical protein